MSRLAARRLLRARACACGLALALAPAGPLLAQPAPAPPESTAQQPEPAPQPAQEPEPAPQPSPEPEPAAAPPEPAAPEPEPAPEPQPAPAPAAKPPSCCRFSVRYDLFQLIFRRVAVEAEVKIKGPFSIGIEPAWIWGGATDTLDEQGFQLLAFFAWTFYGPTLRGFWVRAVGGFEAFDATLKHAQFPDVKVKKGVASGIFGLMLGDSVVFGENGGITLSGSIGAGIATSDATKLIAPSPDPDVPDATAIYYEGASRVKLLGSLGAGVTF